MAWPSARTSGPVLSSKRNLERIGVSAACQGGGLEQPPSAGVDQIALAKFQASCGGEIPIEKLAGRGREVDCFPWHIFQFG